jgi:sulfate transport system permease protein
MIGKYAFRFASLGYLAVLLVAPIGFVFWRTFEHGVGPAWDAVTTPDALHALRVTLILTAIAVPANTIFVSLPFVVREVVPVLREIGTEQEQAAATLGASAFQTFRRVTWPAIRYATAYGVVLTTARALGEFGAVSVVSGRLAGETESLTLFVQDRYQSFDTTGAYAAAVVLALIAMATLLLMTRLRPKEGTQ